jgi:hypothetical protein
MANVQYDVEIIRQEQNPICWVASCAMVKGYGTKASVGVGEFTGGFDPSNSCIANLAGNWSQCTDLMTTWGFEVKSVNDVASGSMTGDALVQALQNKGPCVLLHLCAGFPYGPNWVAPTAGAHAVVITGVDSDAATATFNNPWGDKDQSCGLATLLQHINSDQAQGKTLGFWLATASSSTPAQSADAPSDSSSNQGSTDGSLTPSSDGGETASSDVQSESDDSSQSGTGDG